MSQETIITNTPGKALTQWLKEHPATRIFLLADTTTAQCAIPALRRECPALSPAQTIIIKAGDDNKTLQTLAQIWQTMSESGATRSSLLINVGGGMVTDIGGFAAATFKRGIRSINIPTTLLGAVDAAVGGKTGINFNGLKNEIGAFREAEAVILSSVYFKTLPADQLTSGYAEIIKHALIDSTDALDEVLADRPESYNPDTLLNILSRSVEVKRRIVAADPYECGIRKTLNLGHTAGHAFESMAMRRNSPVPHGHAVAWGLIVAMVLSHIRLGFPAATLRKVAGYIYENYPSPALSCNDYPTLTDIMRHDKKNKSSDAINFTLLKAPGQAVTDCIATSEEIAASLDIFRDLMHI